jgi:hypothetical protein
MFALAIKKKSPTMLLLIVNKEKETRVNLSDMYAKLHERLSAFYCLTITSFSNFKGVKIQFKKNSSGYRRWNFFYIARHFLFDMPYFKIMAYREK